MACYWEVPGVTRAQGLIDRFRGEKTGIVSELIVICQPASGKNWDLSIF